MDDPTTPEVDLDAYTELEADGSVTEIESPEAETETAPTAAEPAQPTSRRSRAVNKGQQQQPEQQPPSVNLDDLPQFREWKSTMDRQIAEERRQREALQAQMRQREQEQIAAQMQALERAAHDADDPDQARQYWSQRAQLEAAQQYAAWQEWDNHVRSRAAEEGLNSADFDPRQYSGTTGAAQFERDLASKKAAKLQAEMDAYKRAADPANIAKLVQQQVAKALQGAGMNAVDTGAPATPVRTGSLDDDIDALNSGRMSHATFKKKWGNA